MTKISYWRVFRLFFVVFSLYLMGDAFYRWDGFKYYASFYEFLLSISLASVLLGILTAVVALLIWLPYRFLEWLPLVAGKRIKKEQYFLFVSAVLLLGTAAWCGKRLVFSGLTTSLQIKISILFFVLGAALLFTWLLRHWIDRIARWMGIIQNRVTPLVWLFGIFVCISVPLVAYHTWFKGADKKSSKEIIQPSAVYKNRPNILLVTFDAMTARNMSVYGYHRQTTPFISEWAKTATLFTKAEAASNYTSPTTASLMTGKRVWTHLRYSRMQSAKPIRADIESLPLVLKNGGSYNIAFIVNIIASVDNLGVAESFDIAPVSTDFWVADNIGKIINKITIPLFAGKFKIHNWFFQDGFIVAKLVERLERDIDETSFPPEKAFNKLLTAIDQGEKPFFAWIHLNPPHSPYLPPKPYKGMFDKSNNLGTFKSQLEGRKKIEDHVASHQRFPSEIEALKARYDEFIRYCDKQFEDFIKQLETRDNLKNTVVILSSDHGEIFDHNSILHGTTLYESETNIPLIIKEPGQSDGMVIDNVVEQIDIPATILDIAGIPVPSWMEGRSLVPHIQGEKVLQKPAFSMNLEDNPSLKERITKGTVAVWDGDYKMIYDLEKEKTLLFNLKKDPGELEDLSDREPYAGQYLLGLIHENLKKANGKIIGEQ